MIRKEPIFLYNETNEDLRTHFESAPCSVLAINCALLDRGISNLAKHFSVNLDKVGYASLANMNKAIRGFLYGYVLKYDYFKVGKRFTFNKVRPYLGANSAIVCVKGHYVYVHNGYDLPVYYSYFDNDNDEVIAIWLLSNHKKG